MRIARWSARLYPCQHRRNLLRRKRRIVGKVPESRVGKPRRHHSALHRFRDSRRPWPRLLVRHQWHGGNFARAMTALTVVLEQGQNVFIESGSWFVGCGEGGTCNQNRRGEESHAEENAHINSVQERNCHPERSGCFASRSSRAVEGPLPAAETFAVDSRPSHVSYSRQDRGPSTPPSHSQANGRIALRMTERGLSLKILLRPQFSAQRPSSALMICADHCATSSSRSVRSADWKRARSSSEYLPAGTLPPRKISTGTKLRNSATPSPMTAC